MNAKLEIENLLKNNDYNLTDDNKEYIKITINKINLTDLIDFLEENPNLESNDVGKFIKENVDKRISFESQRTWVADQERQIYEQRV